LVHKENCPLIPEENVVGRKKILFVLSKGNKSWKTQKIVHLLQRIKKLGRVLLKNACPFE
jgi:hypothetical protein